MAIRAGRRFADRSYRLSVITQPRLIVGLLSVLTLAAAALAAGAAPSGSQPFVGFTKYVRYHVRYEVSADGTHTETYDWALQVLSEPGLRIANQASVSYSDQLQSAEILSAYTLKQNGRRIDVPAANFQEESNKGKGDASPMFSDLRTKTVAFPEVEVGDTVALSYKLTQREAMFPGNFSMTESFSKFQVYDDATVSLSAPAALALHVYQRGVEGGELAPRNGRRNWQWSYRNWQIAIPEMGAVSSLDYGPLIVATTFKDYGALAAAYDSRAEPKAAVTERIRKLADQLTRNAHTPREQAAALYAWVSANIQYAGNCVGVGSVVPHAADLVLSNRMGDCKDHTALLQALLAAKGIASTPALINAGNAYALPPVPSIEVFNHVINYIPSLKLYADSTARFTPFGSLPIEDADKPVIHTAHFAEIQHTPPVDYRQNWSHLTTVIDIHADGSADGETRVEASGVGATELRTLFSYLQPNLEERLIRAELARNGFTGTGTLTKADPAAMAPTYRYSSKYRLTDVINLPGPGAMPIRSPLSGPQSIASFIAGADEPDRTVDFACYGALAHEDFTVHFPKGTEVLAVPRNVEQKGRNMTYRATYQIKGDTVTAVREVEDRTAGNVCTPADAAALKAFAPAVRRDLRAQILYR